MKLSSIFLLACTAFLFSACTPQQSDPAAGLKSLRLLKVNADEQKAFYVPARAIITGPGTAEKPVVMDVGNKKMIQGTLTLAADENELAQLKQILKQQYGKEFSLQKHMSGSYKIALSHKDKQLWEHEVMSNNVSLPVQFMADKTASITLMVDLSFKSFAATQQQNKTVQRSFSSSKTQSGKLKTAAASATNLQSAGNQAANNLSFSLKHPIDL
jgi:hypothetical protein